MKTIDVSRPPKEIWLGRDGENNWRPIAFDCSTLLANHPDGIISLWILPDGESQAFPVALERDGNTVVWAPLSEEMTSATGALQIICTDGTDVGKSNVALYSVGESVVPGAEHPAAAPSWATDTVERAENAAERAEAAAESIDPAQIEQTIQTAVDAYLSEHPVTVDETDPTVPAWAKEPTKPSYTAQEVGALPSDTQIPAAVTEQTVAGWGFTKNTGTYSKPSGGIPKNDLAADVQTSLGKADTALQQHQSLAGYATEIYVQTQIAAIPDELPATADPDSVLVFDGDDWQAVNPAVFLSDNGAVVAQSATVGQIPVKTANGWAAQNIPTELPSVTASDNGKFLRVVNGAWAAETVQTWQGGSY